ncbi:MAG: sigma 54-interacting transcriptional regulator [Candidatus Binatia bacterium]
MSSETVPPARILIVEDESIVAFDISSRLRRLGHTVVGTARSGEAAFQLCAQHRPDLVLMDVRIEGDEDGIDLAYRVRAAFDIPVVFLTAYADPVTLERARGAAPLGYIVKPFDQRDIEVTVQTALGRGRIHRELQRAHDDLKAVLDAQRHGTLLVDAEGRVTFASRAALSILDGEDAQVLGARWQDALGVSKLDRQRLDEVVRHPAGQEGTVLVHVPKGSGVPAAVEVEVSEDARTPGGRMFFLYDVSRVVQLERILDERSKFSDIVGTSDAMKQIFLLIRDYGAVEVPVLVDGETGSGKELVARAIHQSSARAERTFVAVNCAGLSEELAASQLFGHTRGSFTDAVGDYEGLFRAANGGTLFLDEIGELSARVQASLLRVLDERVVYPVGKTRGEPVDVRIVAATNRDLAAEVRSGNFRADLYYRVRAARITLPPLRDRREDIVQLARHFLATQSALSGKPVRGVANDTLRLLHLYDWPGNVRELRNAIAVAAARARGDLILPDDLPPEVLDGATAAAALPQGPTASRLEVLEALHRSGGNRSMAAKLLGVSRATFYRRLTLLGMSALAALEEPEE